MSMAYALIPAGLEPDIAHGQALEALDRLGDVDVSTLERVGPCTEVISGDFAIDAIKYQAHVTPRN